MDILEAPKLTRTWADHIYAGFALHGTVAGTPRPAGISLVIWVGTVVPTNAEAGDLYWQPGVLPQVIP